jgi:hypothetical protein
MWVLAVIEVVAGIADAAKKLGQLFAWLRKRCLRMVR